MQTIGVNQGRFEPLDLVLRAAFNAAGVPVSIQKGRNDAVLCVLSAQGSAAGLSAKIAIVPGTLSCSPTAASEIITYGLCCKNTLTVSSCIDSTLVVSLQRALVTLAGKRVEEQDFPVSISDPDEPELVLAAVAALLAADVPVSAISALAF